MPLVQDYIFVAAMALMTATVAMFIVKQDKAKGAKSAAAVTATVAVCAVCALAQEYNTHLALHAT
jgi:hypothetical protein|tara:strand:- start:654 stop:848 length:195 start_codon:yes stop_codon:yes gene_type:complete